MSSAPLSFDAAPTPESDVRPVVANRQSRLPLYLFIAGMAFLAMVLFGALDSRRRALEAPVTRPDATDLARAGQPLPTLFIPPAATGPDDLASPAMPAPQAPAPIVPPAPRERINAGEGPRFVQAPARTFQLPEPTPSYAQPERPISDPPRLSSSGPILVVDVGNVAEGGPATAAAAGQAGGASGTATPSTAARVRASRLANPSTTVPQGTSIPAVLETALDSTRPGQARALVSLDVRGFDGSQVLIPRGSRLYGEYLADLQAGQNRALIQWTRLLRPDGVVIAIGSPTADRLGRAGVGGKVNTHFFERFFSAILQSSLDLGVAVASRSVGDGGVILLPGSLGQATPQLTQEVRPTLKVKQGKSIAVLVARDLDFGSAAAGR